MSKLKEPRGQIRTALETLAEPTNSAQETISTAQPYVARIIIEGVAPLLLHSWSCESIAAKAGANKGSRAKKTDDIESYVRRNDKNQICLPSDYLLGAICEAARFRQDPRSPRKSLKDLAKAAIFAPVELCPILSAKDGKPTKEWDYIDSRRVVVQRNGITRMRPAFLQGWIVQCNLQVILSQYVTPELLRELIVDAGRLIGVADKRPSYGRFALSHFEIVTE